MVTDPKSVSGSTEEVIFYRAVVRERKKRNQSNIEHHFNLKTAIRLRKIIYKMLQIEEKHVQDLNLNQEGMSELKTEKARK